MKFSGFGRYLKFGLFAAVVAVVMAVSQSCDEVKGEAPQYPVKEKTLLVYMIANNNLSGNAVNNLSDIKRGFVPQAKDGNIVLYYHVPNQNPLLLNVFKDESGIVQVDTAYRFPARNSATMTSLQSAMNVTATMFPADEYGLILWSHGTGWLPVGFYETPVEDNAGSYSGQNGSSSEIQYMHSAPETEEDPFADMVKMIKDDNLLGNNGGASVRSFGSDEGKEMELKDVVAALPYKLSFIIFDACLMGGIEVMYELKDSTDYIISSPAEILSAGFPYSKIMQHIFASPSDLESVAQEYYDLYNNQPTATRYGTISLVKTSELDGVAEVSKEIFEANREKISSVDATQVQRYYRGKKHWFFDFGHFMEQIATPEQLEKFNQALDKAVIYKATTPYFFDIKMEEYSGVSTYIPIPANSTLSKYYKTLKWNEATGFIE